MATITITTQILSGNLGDGWQDNNEAARILARYTRRTWEADLAELADDHTIVCRITVQQNTEGWRPDRRVDITPWDNDAAELERRVDALLSDEQDIWDRFLDSEEATALHTEENS